MSTPHEALYSAERDAQAKEQGLVYIEDLAVNGVMVALKANCAPQGLGFIAHQEIDPQEIDTLGDLLKRNIRFLQREDVDAGTTSVGPSITGVNVSKEFDGKISISADYWDGRPFKTRLTAGENLDVDTLTGFDPFDPWGFDRDQGQGVAQQTVDALRASDYPLSIDVTRGEEGRTFDQARQSAMIDTGDPELNHVLRDALSRFIDPDLG